MEPDSINHLQICAEDNELAFVNPKNPILHIEVMREAMPKILFRRLDLFFTNKSHQIPSEKILPNTKASLKYISSPVIFVISAE